MIIKCYTNFILLLTVHLFVFTYMKSKMVQTNDGFILGRVVFLGHEHKNQSLRRYLN